MKPLALFVPATPLPLLPCQSAASGRQCTRRSVCVVKAKAKGGGRGRKGRSINSKKRSQQNPARPNAEPQAPTASDGMIDMDLDGEQQQNTAASAGVSQLDGLSLPDLPTESIRRRRRRRKSADATAGSNIKINNNSGDEEDAPLSTDEIDRLTTSYRKGGLELVRQIEVEPDFMFRSGQATGEYEFAAALIGTGRPNKQGVYVTPYLQTSHMILLGVILLGTFISYPGFPLTEGSPQVRAYCKIGLALTFLVNSLLAVYAYSEAGVRKQPRAFWCFKVFFLGNIALQELRSNAPIKK